MFFLQMDSCNETNEVQKVYQPRTFYHHKKDIVYSIKYQFNHKTGQLTYAACIWKRFSTEKFNVDVWCRKQTYQTVHSRFIKYPVHIQLVPAQNVNAEDVGYYQLRRLEIFLLRNILPYHGIQDKHGGIRQLDERVADTAEQVFYSALTHQESADFEKFKKTKKILIILAEHSFTKNDLAETNNFLNRTKVSNISSEKLAAYKNTENFISDVFYYLSRDFSNAELSIIVRGYIKNIKKPTLEHIHNEIKLSGEKKFILYLETKTGFCLNVLYK